MVKKYAIIKDGVVQNVIKLEADDAESWELGAGESLVQDDLAGGGDLFVGGKFARPQKPPPDYRELRKVEYPSAEDQFDMQYHDSVDGTTTWADAIAAVKTKYPKP